MRLTFSSVMFAADDGGTDWWEFAGRVDVVLGIVGSAAIFFAVRKWYRDRVAKQLEPGELSEDQKQAVLKMVRGRSCGLLDDAMLPAGDARLDLEFRVDLVPLTGVDEPGRAGSDETSTSCSRKQSPNRP